MSWKGVAVVTEWDALLRVGLAALLGAGVGLERELSEKPAGLRTYMLVAEGAALFMISSLLLGQEFNVAGQATRIDVSRIPATIVSGIGFLGAGMILQSESRIYGLTTAAGVWVAAAVGLLVGAGFYWIAVFGTAVTVVTLVAPRRIEEWLGTWYTSHYRVKRVRLPGEPAEEDFRE